MTEYTSDYFLNLYNTNVLDSQKKEDEEEEKETPSGLTAQDFLTQFNEGRTVEDVIPEEEIQSEQAAQEEQERAELQEKILDEDVELEQYEGEKETVLPEKPVAYDASYFLNQYRAEATQELPSAEPTIAQKLELGARLERHTLGNLFRTLKAGVVTLSNNNTFKENIQQINEERTQDILTSMKNKYGLDFEQYQNDASVITGRVGAAIADPVTFFIPWAKIAKLGKLTATGVGAGIGATDMALYEYAAYGKINPNNVLFGTITGGASSLVGAALANRARSVQGDDLNIGKVDDAVDDTVVKSSVKDEPIINLNAKEAQTLDEVAPIVRQENSAILDELEGSLILNNLYKKAKNDVLAFEELKHKQIKYNRSTRKWEATADAELTQRQINNRKKKFDEASKFLKEDYFDLMESYAKGQAKVVGDTLQIISKNDKYELTDSLLQKILYESFRPLFGAGVGFTAGTFIGDDDDAINYSLMGAGLTFGFVYNRVKDANYLLAGQKEKAFGIINNEAGRMLHNFLKVKGSGTTASRGVNHGGENEILSRLLFLNMDMKHRNIIGAEEASDFITGLLGKRITEVIQNATEKERVAAAKIIKQLMTRAEVKATKEFSNEGMKNIDMLVKNANIFKKEMDAYVSPVVTFNKIENYDLPQIWSRTKMLVDRNKAKNIVKEALKVEFPKWNKAARIATGSSKTDTLDDAAARIVGEQLYETTESVFTGSRIQNGILGSFDGIPQLKNYQRTRIFKSLESRKILEPLLEDDLKVILDTWVGNTVKGVEFARKMGENGQLLGKLSRSLRNKFDEGLITEKEYISKLKLMKNSVNAYFGLYGKAAGDPLQSNLSKDAFALLTFLSNTTMLPRSIVPQLGDFLQPFQNSNIWSATKGFANSWKRDGIARSYGVGGSPTNSLGSTVTKDIEGVFSAGTHPSTRFQERLGEWTRTFFKFNLMAPATNQAARVAFSTGIDEIFTIAKQIGNKKTISKALNTRLQYYGLNRNDIRGLNKFNSVEDALASRQGERILIQAGNKAFKRDVGLPGIGNRMLFAQSNNPLIKSVGLFLSWAQYKVQQMNSLIKRVEDGDVKLAIKMLGTITIFGGLRELQIELSPAREYYDEFEPENFSARWWGEAMGLSGIIDWRAEKVSRVFGTWGGRGHGSGTGAISPLFGYVDRFYNNAGKTYRNFSSGDYEGAAVSSLKTLPLGSELVDYTNRASVLLTEEELFEDRPNRQSKETVGVRGFADGGRVKYFTGEEVSDNFPVQNVIKNPSDRINPITGLPFNAPVITYGDIQ